jgi:muramidase (phage lysozyme)
MRSHAHTTVWETHGGLGRTSGAAGWYQQLKEWWATHKIAREHAKLTALTNCWDAKREAVRPHGAEAAPEMAAAHHAISIATMLYGLSQ